MYGNKYMEIFILFFFVIGWFATTGTKSQFIRLGDIFVYGPFLIYLGYREKENFIKLFLYFIGATTITYNLRNFIEIQNS